MHVLENYRGWLETFQQNQTSDATVGDVLGTQSIREVIREQLSASLPDLLLARKLVASTLP